MDVQIEMSNGETGERPRLAEKWSKLTLTISVTLYDYHVGWVLSP